MRRLDRYIFREILFPGLIALVALTFVVLSHKRRTGCWTSFSANPRHGAEIWAVIAALPPGRADRHACRWRVLVGILTGFSRLSSDSEAIAMRASGISMRRILRPVLRSCDTGLGRHLALTVWVTPDDDLQPSEYA